MKMSLKDIKQGIIDKLENPLCTVNLDNDSLSEEEINDLAAWVTEKGYAYSDGRNKGWNKLWIKKK